MAGVGPAVVPHDRPVVGGQQVNNLALSLIPPLQADDGRATPLPPDSAGRVCGRGCIRAQGRLQRSSPGGPVGGPQTGRVIAPSSRSPPDPFPNPPPGPDDSPL